MKCPNGHEVNDNVKYCSTCGAEIVSVNKFCTKCGSERKGTEKFCSQCGTPIAIAIGYATKSWWWGGGTFLGLLFLSMIPSIGVVMCYLFGAAWGVIGYYLGDLLFGNDAAWVIGIIAALCGIGANLAGRQYFEDIGT